MGTVDQSNSEVAAARQAVKGALLQFRAAPVIALANAVASAQQNAIRLVIGLSGAEFEQARADFHRWLYLTALEGAGASGFVRRFMQLASNATLADQRQFAEDFSWQIQSLSDKVLNTAELHAAQKDWLWSHRVQPLLGNLRFTYGALAVERLTYERLEDEGLPSAVEQFKATYKAYVSTLASVGKSQEQLATASLARDKEATSAIAEAYPLDVVTEAEEREDALIRHIEANKPYYRFAMWRSLDAATQRLRLSPNCGDVIGRLIAPEAVGYYGDRLAFPVSLSAHEKLKTWFADNVTNNSELITVAGERKVTLPTPGIALETRLSQCDACEDYIREQRKIELRTRAAQASKEEHEAERYQQRLKQQPPLLEDPDRDDGPIRIKLEQGAR
jgi:hypothetical protein